MSNRLHKVMFQLTRNASWLLKVLGLTLLLLGLFGMASASLAGDDVGVGDIVINELMIDPNGSDNEREWFEIHNLTGSNIDIDGWIILDDDFDCHEIATANGTTLVPANGKLVLGVTSDAGGANADYVYGSDITLANSGDELELQENTTCADKNGQVIDRFVWGTTFDLVGRSRAYCGCDRSNPSCDTNAEIAANNDDTDRWYRTDNGANDPHYGDGGYGTPGDPNGDDDELVDWCSALDPTSVTCISLAANQSTGWPTVTGISLASAGLLFLVALVLRRLIGRR